MAKRLLLVADVSNLYYCCRKIFNGRKLDYGKYLQAVLQGHDLYRAIAYGAEIGNAAKYFKDSLVKFGYEPKYKEPRIFPSTIPNKENRKADWDVGIAIDVVKMIDSFDIVCFGTADSDLQPCLEYCQARGKECWVYACLIGRELKDTANKYWEIGPELLEENITVGVA